MNRMFFNKPANEFIETMLLGNGRLGAIVYGGVNEDVYELNDDTLWSGYPRDYATDKTDWFEKAKKAALKDDPEMAETYLEETYGHCSQCYLPAGTLRIKGNFGEAVSYTRTLCLDTAVHTTEFSTKQGSILRTAFTSNPDDVLCIRYKAESMLPELTLSLDSLLRPSVSFQDGVMTLEGEAPGDGIASYIKVSEHLIYSEKPEEKGMRYTIALSAKSDGEAAFEDGVLKVTGASFMEVYLTIRTSFAGFDRHPYLDGIDHKSAALQILNAVKDISYEEILKRHVDDFSNLFNRVEFELEGGRDDLPIDERLVEHQNTPDHGLIALFYQFGRYLMISSSRKGTQPTNLQGIWNNSVTPPWSCNYTININTQMNYWGACGANLAECCEPLHRMVYELTKNGKAIAKSHYGAEGFCTHHNTDLWRMCHPVGEWAKRRPDSPYWVPNNYSYFPLGGAWLVRHLFDYYLETNDKEFLGGNAFESILESAKFCDSMLTEYNGGLSFCPGVSPENHFLKDGERYSVARSAAMFQSIVRDAFEICIEACEILNREKAYADYLKERLSRVTWLEISKDGRILEWDEEREEYEPHHRHLSHLYSFYPAKKVTDPALLEACKQTLLNRGDKNTGWSSAWKICLWANLKDGNRALDLILQLMNDATAVHRGGTYQNLLCACPPFQIDGNYGIVAGINEMLAGENNGEIQLLPALPDAWKNGKIKGLRLKGAEIDMEWKDGKITASSIRK